MRLEDYTADAICRAMGLSGFVEQPWTQAENQTLRVVLTPSFHPELCLTFSQSSDSTPLSIAVLLDQLWARPSVVCLPHECEEIDMPSVVFDEVLALFATARASYDPQRRYVYCDGMGSESCLSSRGGTQRLDAHVSSDAAVGKLVTRLIGLAWNSCRRARVRNALAQAARYLEIEYPLQDVPPQPPITRLAILGPPEEKRDCFEMLQRVKKGGT